MTANTILTANENIAVYTVHQYGLDPGPGDRSAIYPTTQWIGAEFDDNISLVEEEIIELFANIATINSEILVIQTDLQTINSSIANIVAGNSNIQFAFVNSSTTYMGQAFNFVSGNQTSVNVSSGGGLINVKIDYTGSAAAGSNTFVQFNDSGAFGGTSDLTFDKGTKTLTTLVGSFVLQLGVGANVVLNTSAFVIGNTSVNLVLNSSSALIGSSLVNTTVISVGSSTMNTTVIQGANLSSSGNVTGTTFLGNVVVGSTTVNSTMVNSAVVQTANLNSSGNVNGVTLTSTTSVTIGANVTINTGTVFVGNSTVNATHNATGFAINGVPLSSPSPAVNADFWVGTNNTFMVTDATVANAYGFVTLSPDAGGNLNPNNAAGINFISTVTKSGTLKNFLNPISGREGNFLIKSTNTSAIISFDTHYNSNSIWTTIGVSSPAFSSLGGLEFSPAGNYLLKYLNVNSTLTLIPISIGPF